MISCTNIPAWDTDCIECTDKSPDPFYFGAGDAMYPVLLKKESGTGQLLKCAMLAMNTHKLMN